MIGSPAFLVYGNGVFVWALRYVDSGFAALEAATGVTATSIGKPEPILYRQALALLQTPTEKTIAIGDRLNTDILGAVNAGIRSILVLTGISTQNDIADVDYQPTWVMADIQEITQTLNESFHKQVLK